MSCHLYKLCVLDAHKGDASFWTCLQDIQEGMQVSIHQHISFADRLFECICYKKNSNKMTTFMFPTRTWPFEM